MMLVDEKFFVNYYMMIFNKFVHFYYGIALKKAFNDQKPYADMGSPLALSAAQIDNRHLELGLKLSRIRLKL